MDRRPRVIAGCLAVAALTTGCGGDSEPIVLPPQDSVTDTTATSVAPVGSDGSSGSAGPATPTSAAAEAREWVDVTGNLVGLASECGNMSYVSAHPTRDQLIAGIAQQGLWTSADGGASWSRLGQGAGSDAITNRTSAIVYDPNDPEAFWESGIYNGGGVYHTSDGGNTFRQLGDAAHSDLVAVDLGDPERRTLLSGTHEQPIVLRSTDAGNTWSEVTGLPADIGMAIAPFVVDRETHLLGTKSGAATGIFRTTDGGATWDRVFDSGVSSPPLVSPTDGAIYWLAEGGGALLRSDDEGATWESIPGRIAAGANTLVELPDGRFVTTADRFLIISADRGRSWNPIGTPLPFAEPPTGIAYSAQRKEFVIWRFTCDQASDNSIAAGAIMSLPFDYETE